MTRYRANVRARSVLIWFVILFGLTQTGLLAYLDFWRPEAFSAEFEARIRRLRTCVKAEPRRPLLVLLGSSRMTLGFRPEILPPLLPDGQIQPLVFNFAHFGSGATMNLQLLQRLLHEGIRLRWLVVELMPPKISHDSACWPLTASVLSELPALCRYFPAWKVLSVYGRIRLSPWNAVRPYLQGHVAPALRRGPVYQAEEYALDPLGGDSHWQAQRKIEPAEKQRRTQVIGASYAREMQSFAIQNGPDRATRDLISLCGRHNIPVVFLLSPESQEFQRCYPAEALDKLRAYCRQLQQAYGAPVIDARDWLADEEFADGHHPMLSGADTFTLRLGREVLQPLVQGGTKVPIGQSFPDAD
jgi:hypothetical protein